MTQNRFCRAAKIALPAFLALLAGCEGSARRTSPAAAPDETPAAPLTSPEPVIAPSAPPAAGAEPQETPETPPAAAIEPAPARPPEAPKPAEPELPPYIRVVERFRPSEPALVHLDDSSPERLVVETRNVRRLWIDRERAPLVTNRSVVLRLDGQGIEWTGDSRTREFEKSVNGEWGPARERKR